MSLDPGRDQEMKRGCSTEVEALLVAEFRKKWNRRPLWADWRAWAVGVATVAIFAVMLWPAQRPAPVAAVLPVVIPAAVDTSREITSAFITLRPGEAIIPPEGASMVRVGLPRASLASFGLPANPEFAGERIQADVILGMDGQARAIRFVSSRSVPIQ